MFCGPVVADPESSTHPPTRLARRGPNIYERWNLVLVNRSPCWLPQRHSLPVDWRFRIFLPPLRPGPLILILAPCLFVLGGLSQFSFVYPFCRPLPSSVLSSFFASVPAALVLIFFFACPPCRPHRPRRVFGCASSTLRRARDVIYCW